MKRIGVLLIFAVFPCSGFTSGLSGETSVEPYIDQLRRKMAEKDAEKANESGSKSQGSPSDIGVSDPYLQSIKRKLEGDSPAPSSSESYIDKLRRENPSLNPGNPSVETSYSEQLKATLEPKKEGGAIQAVLDGNSELEVKKPGIIHHAFGFRYGAFLNRAISAGSGIQTRNFNDVYGANYAPDFSLFYEYQPFHSEWFGNIGIVGLGGVGYFNGLGQLSQRITNPATGAIFPSTTGTKFQFFTVPVTVALDYRMNIARVIRPFILAGPTLIGYTEMRNDGGDNKWGKSLGFFVSAGTSFSLDWVKESWNLYSSFGIKHYYFSVDYSQLVTLSGDVNVGVSGFNAGFTFEY